MSNVQHIQNDFSGGEISGRLLMREDTAMYRKSVGGMVNYIPTLQGTAVRTPGTRFFRDVTALGAVRIIPFFSQGNDETLIVMAPATAEGANNGSVTVIQNPLDTLDDETSSGGAIPPGVPTKVFKTISKNNDFREGLDNWWVAPTRYGADADLGAWIVNTDLLMVCRDWSNGPSSDSAQVFAAQAMTVPEDTDTISLTTSFAYLDNFNNPEGKFIVGIAIGTAPLGNDVYSRQYNETNLSIGTAVKEPVTITTYEDDTPLSLLAGSTLYFQLTITAIESETGPSTPSFVFYSNIIQSSVTVLVTEDTAGEPVPYTAEELKDVHYVQSPYIRAGSGGKEMIFTHPNYPPKWLRFGGGVYVFEDVPFQDAAGLQARWLSTGYPATCTSFNGRLILAGSTVSPIPGSTEGSGSETVWGTESGNWVKFSESETEVNPDDAIEFTVIYRSPIQWVAGQKELLIGARAVEYVASADGIFQPADLGVSMHSSHGSINVQPVAVGETVLFAADDGTRVRAMNFRQDTDGYTAPDMTFWHPYLFQSKIVRGFRMRNPHQIAGWVMGNGQIALFSFDPNAGISGWSRINLNAVVRDACVLQDDDGQDVLFITVERVIGGVTKTYIEAFRNWDEFTYSEYTQSSNRYTLAGTNICDNLDHLEGERVQVVADNNFLGEYIVSGGQIALIDQLGLPINVSTALVGLPMVATMVTLPPPVGMPQAKKRYPTIYVRGVFTTYSKINGVRPNYRLSATHMGSSQPIEFLADWEVVNMGTDDYQFITIEETAPFRSEVIGIFGTVKVSSV